MTIPQLRAEEDSARKIGGADADDGGRGDKEGLNLKVLIITIRRRHFYQKTSPCDYMKFSCVKKYVNIKYSDPGSEASP